MALSDFTHTRVIFLTDFTLWTKSIPYDWVEKVQCRAVPMGFHFSLSTINKKSNKRGEKERDQFLIPGATKCTSILPAAQNLCVISPFYNFYSNKYMSILNSS